MTSYLIESTLFMAVAFVIYGLILRKHVSYTFNRFFLLASLVLSQGIHLLKLTVPMSSEGQAYSMVSRIPESMQLAVLQSPHEIENAVRGSSSIDFMQLIYLLGVVFSLIVLSAQLYRYFIIRQYSQKHLLHGYQVFTNSRIRSPFSFFGAIYCSDITLLQEHPDIFFHEKAHIDRRHTYDHLLLGVFRIALWFNPLVYLFQRAIRQEHEFEADALVVGNGYDSRAYLHKVVNYSASSQFALASSFSYASLKNRIHMISKQQNTNKSRVWLAFSASIIAVTLLACDFQETPIEGINGKFTVVIDPGHGGKDPGASSFGMLEKDLTIKYALALKKRLEELGDITVILTRDEDYVALLDRAQLASGADLFLSLHINYSESPEEDQFILNYSDENEFATSSKEALNNVLASFTEHKAELSYQRFAWFPTRYVVLRNSKCPAIQVDLGHMSNPSRLEFLNSEVGKERLTAILSKGVISYLAKSGN